MAVGTWTMCTNNARGLCIWYMDMCLSWIVLCWLFVNSRNQSQWKNIIIDFVFSTTNVGNTGFGDETQLSIPGTEAVLKIVREILIGKMHWVK